MVNCDFQNKGILYLFAVVVFPNRYRTVVIGDGEPGVSSETSVEPEPLNSTVRNEPCLVISRILKIGWMLKFPYRFCTGKVVFLQLVLKPHVGYSCLRNLWRSNTALRAVASESGLLHFFLICNFSS